MFAWHFFEVALVRWWNVKIKQISPHPYYTWHVRFKVKKWCSSKPVFLMLNQGKGGSITVPLTSCLTCLESAVWLLTIFVFICKMTNPNQSNRRSMVQWYFPPKVFPGLTRLSIRFSGRAARERAGVSVIENFRSSSTTLKFLSVPSFSSGLYY
jgi:hypothetical protein